MCQERILSLPVGKGIRGAPRDALVADVTPPEIRGAAYGLRQTLDTMGGFLGPLLAVGLILLWSNDFRAVYWVAVVPAFMAVILLFFGLHEPRAPVVTARTNPVRKENLKRLGVHCWWVIGLGGVFTLARFSVAFLVLRAQEVNVWTLLETNPFLSKSYRKKYARVREITQAKEVVPGTASIYGLCFSAGGIIPVLNEAVCDPILRIIPA